MFRYAGKRLLSLIPILLIVTFISFSLMYLAPGDPAQQKLTAQGVPPSDDVLAATRENMGLNDPFFVRYGRWLGSFLRGDLGESYVKSRPVSQLLGEAMKKTALVAGAALLLSLIIALPLGAWAAIRRNTVTDYLIRFLTLFGNSTPAFLAALLLVYFFCIRLQWLPVLAEDSLQGLILPTITLSLPCTGRIVKQVRSELLEQLAAPYVLGAQARGVKPRLILVCDVLHNAMPSILTVISLSVGGLLSGSVVIETIFQWPGVGKLVMDAISSRDYPVIQGFVVYIAVIYILVHLFTDMAQRKLDPRTDS